MTTCKSSDSDASKFSIVLIDELKNKYVIKLKEGNVLHPACSHIGLEFNFCRNTVSWTIYSGNNKQSIHCCNLLNQNSFLQLYVILTDAKRKALLFSTLKKPQNILVLQVFPAKLRETQKLVRKTENWSPDKPTSAFQQIKYSFIRVLTWGFRNIHIFFREYLREIFKKKFKVIQLPPSV